MNTATCVVAIKRKDTGDICMAGDSAGSSGWKTATFKDEKVFKKGSFLYGYTSSYRMGQLLQYELSEPDVGEHQDISTYMRTTYIDAVRECFKGAGYASVDSNKESGGIFMVAFRGRLFVVESNFQVLEPDYPYYAIGCGQETALGALRVIERKGIGGIEDCLRMVLATAEEFSGGVRRPFHMISTESGETVRL